MRRTISLPADVYDALIARCSEISLSRSEAIRRAVSALACSSDIPSNDDQRWSQSYRGTVKRRLALILIESFDMAMRRAAVKRHKSVNAFYTLAVREWLLKGAGSTADTQKLQV